MLFLGANTSFIIRLKCMTITDHFPWPLKCVLPEFLIISHGKQSYRKSGKGGICAISKLIYFKTQLLELVESSM